MSSSLRIRVLLALLALATAVLVVTTFDGSTPETPRSDFSELAVLVDDGQIDRVTFTQGSAFVIAETVEGETLTSLVPPGFTDEFAQQLLDSNRPITVETVSPSSGFPWGTVLGTVLPLLLMVVLVWAILTRMGGGSGKRAKKQFTSRTRTDSDTSSVTFDDVAGASEAIVELNEIKQFLADPSRFHKYGAKIPKGVLLYGPPGTGKTLIARAVAGEAGVPFYTLSGSDFVETYAGVGASRVRALFEEARKTAPAIIFVDEIDAVGRHRGGGGGAGDQEREATLNQLLVEMDGFDVDSGVIFIAATNRPDILDKALLRPGRFDRQIGVETPDLAGRREIVAVHAKNKLFGENVDIESIARQTPGFTGADIANLLNEAALLSARREKPFITQAEVEDALDRVVAGPERSSTTLSEKEKHIIAYHEAGHALVGHLLPNTDPIHKVTIIPRGRALGWTLALPERDKVLRSQSELTDEMAMLLGGRIAEELIFGDPTTGAVNDIERVTAIARSMVTTFGMSPTLGLQKFGIGVGESYAAQTSQNYSDIIASKIDSEVQTLVDRAAEEAREILTLHRPVLDTLAERLIEDETLNKDELSEIFAGLPVFQTDRASDPRTQDPSPLDLRNEELSNS